MSEITTTRVISAIYDLRRAGRWPTIDELAKHLEVHDSEIKGALGKLRGARLFRSRQRGGRKVWMPWGEA